MPGIQESSPQSKTLSKEGKHQLGEYNLTYLLKHGIIRERTASEFNEIETSVASEAYIKIPTDLVDKLGFNSLNWIAFSNKDSLTPLFIGKNTKSIKLINNDFRDADATIEIAQRVNFVNGVKENNPFYLRLAGTYLNQVVALTYDLTEDNRLIRINISFPSAEFDKESYNDMLSLLSKSIVPLNFSESRPYFTAALTTPKMREEKDPKILEHEYAFSFESKSKGIILPKRPYIAYDPDATAVFSKLGYDIKRKDGLVTIMLGIEAAKRRDIRPWKIILPEALPKV